MIFPKYNYKLFHNENKAKWKMKPTEADINAHNRVWKIMTEENYEYCKNPTVFKKLHYWFWVKLFKRCLVCELPSFHWHWAEQVNECELIILNELKAKLAVCKKDPSRIPVLFNNTTTIEMIEKDIENRTKNLK